MSKFQTGDRVKVSGTPGMSAEPLSGFVCPSAYGVEGTVEADGTEIPLIRYVDRLGRDRGQYVNEAHLTLIEDEEVSA